MEKRLNIKIVNFKIPNELSKEKNELSDAYNYVDLLRLEKKAEYSRLMEKRRVNPVKLMDLKNEVENLQNVLYKLEKYSMLLTDISNNNL